MSKWKAYQSNDYEEGKEYALVFDDGKEAQFLLGSAEFFNLKRYKEETGKDYKWIVLYLCTLDDLTRSEEVGQDSTEWSDNDVIVAPPEAKKARSQVQHDEMIARQLQSQFNNETDGIISIVDDEELVPMSMENKKQLKRHPDEKGHSSQILVEDETVSGMNMAEETLKYTRCADITQQLTTQVDDSGQFYFVIRWGSILQRQLNIWQCETKRRSPKKKVMVHFAGESGIDSGEMTREIGNSSHQQ